MKELSIIIPLKNRTQIEVDYVGIPMKILLRHNVELSEYDKYNPNYSKTNIERIRLDLLLNNLSSLETIKGDDELYEVILVDFGSTDYDLSKLSGKYKRLDIRVINVDDYFSRGKGLNIGYDNAKYNNLFFCDADMLFKSREVIDRAYNYLNLGKVYFPICFDFCEPTHQFGYWRRSGYGICFCTKSLLLNYNYRWSEYNSLGKEDNDIWDFFNNIGKCERDEVCGYFHQWHPPSKDFKNQNYKNSDPNKKKVYINIDMTNMNCDNSNDNILSLNKFINNLRENNYYITDKLESGIDIVMVSDMKLINSMDEIYSYKKKFNSLMEILYIPSLLSVRGVKIRREYYSYVRWIRKLLSWLLHIETENYKWSINGYDDYKLSAASLFAKLAVIYNNYHKFNSKKIVSVILKYKTDDNIYKDIEGDINIISETRQAMSALLNLNHRFNDYDIGKLYKDRDNLFFMTDDAWKNPWAAGAQLSHYLFFCHFKNDISSINNILKKLERYEHNDGWYYGKPKEINLINGIMKVFTGFDVINKPIKESIIRGITDKLLSFNDYSGGCGVYDYVYVLTKCMEINYRVDECRERLFNVYSDILMYQQDDGGFKYNKNNEIATKYYNKSITPDGWIGSIHATTVFSMAMARLDKYLGLGLNLNLPVS